MVRMWDEGDHLFDQIEETGKANRQSKARLNNFYFQAIGPKYCRKFQTNEPNFKRENIVA